MKSAVAVIALGLAATVSAQSQCSSLVAAIPACASTCIVSAGSSAGCAQTDLACQCTPASSSAIQAAAFNCVLSGCGEVTGLAVQADASSICACVSSAGPASSSAPATSASPTSAPATSASATSGASPASSAASGSPATSAVSSASVASSAGSASSVGTTSAPSSGFAGSTGTLPTSSITPFTGGAPMVVGTMGGIMGAVLAAIAAL